MDHDQIFKNLILDYPHDALGFFISREARHISRDVRITPIREEQLKDRLGDRFRELEVSGEGRREERGWKSRTRSYERGRLGW